MQTLNAYKANAKFVLTDIDDTLTDEGRLGSEAYQAMWDLHHAGVHVIPVTGRPAGWCEMIARAWPVSGVIGENGGFYFRYHKRQMRRHFFCDEKTQRENREKLDSLKEKILKEVPGCALASDQFARLMDLAIDFCEDVPALPRAQGRKIVELFEQAGAHAKVSSIHVNGWFGDYDKLSQSLEFLRREFGVSPDDAKTACAFIGDSPNDEPMWRYFPNGFAVANIQNFLDDVEHKPAYVADFRGGRGFAQIATRILDLAMRHDGSSRRGNPSTAWLANLSA
jgi:HAD superfamily hydrolase (TIGR01484 family)